MTIAVNVALKTNTTNQNNQPFLVDRGRNDRMLIQSSVKPDDKTQGHHEPKTFIFVYLKVKDLFRQRTVF